MIAHMEKQSQVLQQNEELNAEIASLNQELKSWSGALPAKKLDSSMVIASRWANRHADSFHLQAFNELKEDIRLAGGNVQAIKVRPIPATDPQRYEVVFGHRRHRACLDLGLPVLAIIDSVDDATLFVDMDRENRQRADLRPYEQGAMYQIALDGGLFASQRLLAEAVGLSQGSVSKAVRIAELPEEVLSAFPSRLDIQYRWGGLLWKLLDSDKDTVLARAVAISAQRQAGEKLTPDSVFARLTVAVKATRTDPGRTLKIGDRVVAQIREADGRFFFTFGKGVLSSSTASEIEAFVLKTLTDQDSRGDEKV